MSINEGSSRTLARNKDWVKHRQEIKNRLKFPFEPKRPPETVRLNLNPAMRNKVLTIMLEDGFFRARDAIIYLIIEKEKEIRNNKNRG